MPQELHALIGWLLQVMDHLMSARRHDGQRRALSPSYTLRRLSGMLPASQREPVIGDLVERFHRDCDRFGEVEAHLLLRRRIDEIVEDNILVVASHLSKRVMQRLIFGPDSEIILGDLHEGYNYAHERHGRTAACLFYAIQMTDIMNQRCKPISQYPSTGILREVNN